MDFPSEKKYNYFIDEAGDTTFFGKGKLPVLGVDGVSNHFILGLAWFNCPLQPIRNSIIQLQNEVVNNPYFKVGSVLKKIKQSGGFYFHATDDIPEIRKLFYDFIKTINCTFEAVVTVKDVAKFIKKHNRNDKEMYADLLSHLLHNKLETEGKHVFMVSQRGNTTRMANLENGLNKAIEILKIHNPNPELKSQVIFDVVNQKNDPLLNFTDYLCWAVQRKFEKGEERFFDFISEKIAKVQII